MPNTSRTPQNSNQLSVSLQILPHGAGLPVPSYATVQSAGMDLCAAVDANLTLTPGQRALVPTGLAIALPIGHEAQIRPRSGLAAKNGVTVLNTPGTIDADYRGEIKVILINRPDVGAYGGGSEAANALAASAIAAALFDATGKVVRRLPLRPAYVQAVLKA